MYPLVDFEEGLLAPMFEKKKKKPNEIALLDARMVDKT